MRRWLLLALPLLSSCVAAITLGPSASTIANQIRQYQATGLPVESFTVEGDTPGAAILPRLIAFADDRQITTKLVSHQMTYHNALVLGVTTCPPEPAKPCVIFLSTAYSANTQAATLVHELAHALRHPAQDADDFVEEVFAGSVALLADQQLGIPSLSVDTAYLTQFPSWRRDWILSRFDPMITRYAATLVHAGQP